MIRESIGAVCIGLAIGLVFTLVKVTVPVLEPKAMLVAILSVCGIYGGIEIGKLILKLLTG